jgi:hypothetical protein
MFLLDGKVLFQHGGLVRHEILRHEGVADLS